MSPRPTSPLTLEYTLLGLLDRRPAHGYDLHRAFTSLEGMGLVWSLKLGMLYAMLAKLEGAGLVSAQAIPGESSPARKEYLLTPAGRAAYLEWRQSPVTSAREMRLDFLARLYFAGLAGAATAQQLIARQRTACQTWLDSLERQAAGLGSSHPFEGLVYDFRIRQVQAMLDWLDTCDRRLSV